MNADGLAAAVLALEKAITRNQRQRARHPEDPSQFVASEVDVDEKLEALQTLAASPELFGRFVSLNGVRSVLGLLTHENADVSISAVKLLAELTDNDVLIAETTEAAHADALVDEVVKREGLELLVQNLQRLDEAEEEEQLGVHLTLRIVENLLEFRPELALVLTSRTHLLVFLLTRVNAKDFDENKFYASEILALLLQTDQENAQRVCDTLSTPGGGTIQGLETLLTACARYRKADPDGAGEEECVENLFNALCTALLQPRNRQTFHSAEGPTLLVRILRERRFASGAALRALAFALQGHGANALQFVEQGGLKVVFPPFMGRGLYRDKRAAGSGGRSGDARRMAVEHAVSVVAHTVLGLTPDPSDMVADAASGGAGESGSAEPRTKKAKLAGDRGRSEALGRVLHKFVEKNFEKVDRLCELFFRAEAQLRETEKRLDRGDELEDALAYEAERLGGGLGQMQQLAVVLGAVFVQSASCRRQIEAKFQQSQRPLGMVGDVLEHYAQELVGDASEVLASRRKLQLWASVFD